ncbi:ComF family protein [Malonomonas rubra]|uniref:ComF family protein n=1 Tax=Malonomonas rubra TaxID=57040 RepID=UPI0013795763|nr:ComF family protein [Malonomonas rubra]
MQNPPAFSQVHALGRYEKSLREAIHQFKFNNQVSLDRPLAEILAAVIPPGCEFDLIVPVPLSPARLRHRSFNQALLLGRELGKRLAAPVENGLLVKQVETIAQHDLSASERQRNLQGAFRVTRNLSGERVLLVDDVMTTGSTLRACSSVLQGAGSGDIQVAVLGRA